MSEPSISLEQLNLFPLLEGLKKEDLVLLLDKLEYRPVPARDVVFSQGDQGEELFLLLSGTIRIVLLHEGGTDLTLAWLSRGEFFGEMCLLDRKPRSASAIAAEDCELLVLSRSAFFEFLATSPGSVSRLLALLSCRLRQANDSLENVSFLTVRRRLAGLLWELADRRGESDDRPGLILPRDVKHQVLAESLSTSRENVSRELARLQSRGLVAQEGRRIRVLQVEGLKALFEGQG